MSMLAPPGSAPFQMTPDVFSINCSRGPGENLDIWGPKYSCLWWTHEYDNFLALFPVFSLLQTSKGERKKNLYFLLERGCCPWMKRHYFFKTNSRDVWLGNEKKKGSQSGAWIQMWRIEWYLELLLVKYKLRSKWQNQRYPLKERLNKEWQPPHELNGVLNKYFGEKERLFF